MPDVNPGVRPAQMGNLNKDSTHPNPWYPATEYERATGFTPLYRIYNGDPRGPLTKGYNFIEEDGFLANVRWAAWKGWGFGTILAINDIVNVNRIDAPRARLARYCFIMPPYFAMTVSFICAREVLGNVSKEKNALWTYPAAVIAPGTIWGIFRNSFERGARFTVAGAILAAAWKWNKENGGILVPEGDGFSGTKNYGPQDYDHERGIFRAHNADPQGWKGWPFPIDSFKTWWTPIQEPTWKKHVSPEEAKRGPPTNF
jgi:hypothetical protein